MIDRNELVKIGQFKKPHGIKGEIVFSFTDDSFDESECSFLICEMDGIFVPFRRKNCRFTSGTSAHVCLENIDSQEKARLLTNKEVFFPKKYIREKDENDSFSWDSFVGFTLKDEKTGTVGCIAGVDETTLNALFIVENEEDEILIPAAEDLIVRIDENQKELWLALPEGLLGEL